MAPSFTQPALVLSRNLNTAPTFLLSNKRSHAPMLLGLEVTWRANSLLLFYGASFPVLLFMLPLPEMSPIPPHRAMISVFHVGHSLKRYSQACLPLLHRQHIPESTYPHLSLRKIVVVAWPLNN